METILANTKNTKRKIAYKCVFCNSKLLWNSCEDAKDRCDGYDDDNPAAI